MSQGSLSEKSSSTDSGNEKKEKSRVTIELFMTLRKIREDTSEEFFPKGSVGVGAIGG